MCPPAPAPAGEKERLLARYRDHLVGERGLVPAVVSRYLKAAGLFLDQFPGAAVGQPALDAAAVSVFCARELPRHSRANAANLASALRSFLRFLHLKAWPGRLWRRRSPPWRTGKDKACPGRCRQRRSRGCWQAATGGPGSGAGTTRC